MNTCTNFKLYCYFTSSDAWRIVKECKIGDNNNNNNIALVIAPHILVASSRALYIITLTSTCFIPTHTSTPRGAYSTCSHI